jgi:hypothetical protein
MENKFKQFINDNKGFVVFYLIWFLLLLVFVVCGDGESGIWPFGNDGFEMDDYGFDDFIFWIIAPIIIFFLWKLIGKDVKKAIDDNK